MGRGMVMDRAQRWIVGVAFPAAFVGALVVPYLLVRADLPSPIAVHFELGGPANGSMPVVAFLLMDTVLAGGSAVVLALAAWRPGSLLGIQAAVAAFVGVTVSWVHVMVLLANEGHGRWQDVTLGSGAVWGATASALGASVPVALLIQRHDPPVASGRTGRLPLAEGERAAWFGGARSVPVGLVAIGTACVAVVVLNLGTAGIGPGLAVLVAAVVVGMFVDVRVRVSDQGLAVRSGLVPWPRLRIPLERIVAVQAVDLNPWRWGGWGYRGSVRLFRRAAWVVRKGPAVEVELDGDRRFAVTVDDADEAAATLAALLTRARAPE